MALGMNSGEIPDSAITASSSFDPESVGPTSARFVNPFTRLQLVRLVARRVWEFCDESKRAQSVLPNTLPYET